MTYYSLSLIALALSLDAFGVALSIGLNPGVKLKNKFIFCLSFGFFQFLFSFVGSYAGIYFTNNIKALPHLFGGIIILIVGVLMVKEGFEEKQECLLFTGKMYIILGASVSIDALVVGFTMFGSMVSFQNTLLYTVIIGLVTFVISVTAFIISRYLNKISLVARYADYIGGIILIIFGLRMIFMG
ncbi:manganese efflux pump [Clostridium thermarum]|uniref:manganese efflux pump n=1 Tax=Clostridium thermarum TaxID=1716543 RepID=UPI00111D8E9A|nr:manganese efflux pump [Clostridium thermarum]